MLSQIIFIFIFFKGLCRAKLKGTAVVKLQTIVLVETIDYHGHPRNSGGDPIKAELTVTDSEKSQNQTSSASTSVKDLENGIYEVIFRPAAAGKYALKISVFERPIKDFPLLFEVTEHNTPIKVYGHRGSGKDEFHQPVAVAVDDHGMIYVVDTGNCRIKVNFA